MVVEKINNKISLLNFTEKGEYFPKSTKDFSEGSEAFYQWFSPNNNYPQTVIDEIRKGTTLESILFEDLIYKTGAGFNSDDAKFENYINSEILNSDNETFKSLFKKSNDSYSKLGNVFIEVITDVPKENQKPQLLSLSIIQPQKCRLAKKGNKVVIYSDWQNFNKKKAVELPLYPKFKTFSFSGIKVQKSVYHIKQEALGFDHYGINDKMFEALLLNEKEHRRNNWQLSQIKRGFRRDFFLVSEFAVTEKEKKITDAAFDKMAGDDYAGGVENIEAENAKLVPAQSNYDFDFTKDDTSDQLFLKMGFPRSLIGIKSGNSFSVEQVESDYDQYLPKVENQQKEIINHFNVIFAATTEYENAEFSAINTPPSVVLQNYMPYMNDVQKNIVIEKLFKKYGI